MGLAHLPLSSFPLDAVLGLRLAIPSKNLVDTALPLLSECLGVSPAPFSGLSVPEERVRLATDWAPSVAGLFPRVFCTCSLAILAASKSEENFSWESFPAASEMYGKIQGLLKVVNDIWHASV